MRFALKTVIERGSKLSAQASTVPTAQSSSKAEAAIRKLRQNERLSWAELNRPMTI
jgi:hypothetical protein